MVQPREKQSAVRDTSKTRDRARDGSDCVVKQAGMGAGGVIAAVPAGLR